MRRRITLVSIAAATLAVFLLAVPLGIILGRGYVSDERLELQRAAAGAAASLRSDRTSLGTAGIDRSEVRAGIYDRSGHLVHGTGPTHGGALVQAALRGAESTGDLGNGLAVAAPVSDGDQIVSAVLLQSDLGAAHHRALIAWFAIAGIGLGAIAISTTGAWLIGSRLARPLDQLRDGAARIGAGDLDARVPVSGIAEFDLLAETLNDSAARIQTMIGRERSFSAEVSHQLRTPLSGLRLELEALGASRGSNPHIDSALDSVDRLDSTITDIITLARDLPGHEVSHLAGLMAGVDQRWRAPLAAATRPLRILIESGLPDEVMISTRAATQILDILVENARRHGRGAVTVQARALGPMVAVDVRDEGPTLTREAHELFQGRNGSRDGGIGLPFARKLAEAENARVTLRAKDPPTFSLIAAAVIPSTPT